MLAAATAVIGPMAPSVLRQELVKLVADRLGLGEQLVNDALRGRSPAVAPPWERRDHGGRRGGRDGGRRGGGRDRFRDGSPPPPPEPVDPRAALTRREQSEAAFLAYCLALPDEGEARLAEVDLDDYFSAPTTRKAAAYLRGRLRTPTANLPPGDDEFARLIAELVVRSGALEATPAKLELEALQLDLHRLERHISSARLTGATGVTALAAQRQKVLDEIRHRLL
jgi:DNA primase